MIKCQFCIFWRFFYIYTMYIYTFMDFWPIFFMPAPISRVLYLFLFPIFCLFWEIFLKNCVLQHKKVHFIKKRLYSVTIRTRTRPKYLRVSKKNINFAPDLDTVVLQNVWTILKIVHFANYT